MRIIRAASSRVCARRVCTSRRSSETDTLRTLIIMKPMLSNLATMGVYSDSLPGTGEGVGGCEVYVVRKEFIHYYYYYYLTVCLKAMPLVC